MQIVITALYPCRAVRCHPKMALVPDFCTPLMDVAMSIAYPHALVASLPMGTVYLRDLQAVVACAGVIDEPCAIDMARSRRSLAILRACQVTFIQIVRRRHIDAQPVVYGGG